MNSIKTHRRCQPVLLLSTLTAAVTYGSLAQALSSTTESLQGTAPEASNIQVINVSNPGAVLTVGDDIRASYDFTDADGDTDTDTQVQWFHQGLPIAGATSFTYSMRGIDVTNLSVQITPATSAAITDPSVGLPTSLVVQPVNPRNIVSLGTTFSAPPKTLMGWWEAHAHCQSLGGDLPTDGELQQLFADATRSPTWFPLQGAITNNDLCTVYGWPLANMCGGTGGNGVYWSDTPYGATNTPSHMYVDMHSGNTHQYDNSLKTSVTCKI